jgi:hypothetical protein
MMDKRLKVEIAQRELSDLMCGWHVNIHHASRKPSDCKDYTSSSDWGRR